MVGLADEVSDGLAQNEPRFPDQQACIKYLEEKRCGEQPCCPHCGSQRVGGKQEGKRIGRWNCHGCKSSFNVLSGTIQGRYANERIMVPLPKWFLAIGLMVNAKRSLSSCQLARDVGLNTKTAWFMQQRIRAGMAANEASLLRGIVEVDETYVGGKPRKENRREDDPPGGSASRAYQLSGTRELKPLERDRREPRKIGQSPTEDCHLTLRKSVLEQVSHGPASFPRVGGRQFFEVPRSYLDLSHGSTQPCHKNSSSPLSTSHHNGS